MWLVQNFTSVAPDWHDAPVTVDPSGLAEADASVDGDVAALALGLAAPPPVLGAGLAAPPQAATVMANTANSDHRDRRTDRFIAPPRCSGSIRVLV
ncbi:MAG TPA: hypothetical protein VGK63_02825 [Candidatus Limnocylindrales bacterium]